MVPKRYLKLSIPANNTAHWYIYIAYQCARSICIHCWICLVIWSVKNCFNKEKAHVERDLKSNLAYEHLSCASTGLVIFHQLGIQLRNLNLRHETCEHSVQTRMLADFNWFLTSNKLLFQATIISAESSWAPVGAQLDISRVCLIGNTDSWEQVAPNFSSSYPDWGGKPFTILLTRKGVQV